MESKKVRGAKLHAKYQLAQNKEYPWLNLSGVWLAQAGFPIGQKIEIKVANKQLLIKAVE